ncbi:hypothetical protein R6Q59_016266 [Mikania micrantha]
MVSGGGVSTYKSLIDVSEDPIVGRNQKGPDFWSKIRSQFFQAMGCVEYRTNDMISSKWRDMNQKNPDCSTVSLKRSKASSTDSPSTSDARVHINLNELDDDDEIEDLTRPIGRDRAKTDRARARRALHLKRPPDYNQGIEHLSQRIGDFNELKRERQRLVELQLLFTNIEHLTGVDLEIAEREKEKIRNKYRDN